MYRVLIGLMICHGFLFTGCWKSPAAADREQDPPDGQQSAAEGTLGAAGQINPQKLAELTRKANQFESQREFSQAAEVWAEVRELVSKQFGAQSWQATNATVAKRTAEKQVEISKKFPDEFEQLVQLQKQIRQHLAASNYAGSLETAEKVCGLVEQLFGGRTIELARVTQQRAAILERAGRADEAIAVYEFIHQLVDEHLGTDHPDTEAVIFDLGRLNLLQQNNETAVYYFRQAKDVSKNVWGDDTLIHAHRLNELAIALERAGKSAEALPLLEKAVNIRRDNLPPEHPAIAHSLINLGKLAVNLQQMEKAETALSTAVELLDAGGFGKSESTISAKTLLAGAQISLGKYAECETRLNEIAKLRLETAGEQNPHYATTLYQLGMAQLKQQKYDQAETTLRKALDIQMNILGSQHRDTQKSVSTIASILESTDRSDVAQQFLGQYR